MEERKYCAAVVKLGYSTYFFEGEDFFDILNMMSDYQDLNCLINQARMMGTPNDIEVADRMENWLYNFNGSPGDMHRFDDMDFDFSIGEIKCLEWVQGTKEECQALKKKHRL